MLAAKEFVYIGNVGSIEFNHKPLEVGKKGQEVCIKIDHVGGDAPKMIGRHFEPTDKIVSRVSILLACLPLVELRSKLVKQLHVAYGFVRLFFFCRLMPASH